MIPNYLSHKPIVGVDNYNNIDGHFNPSQTDVESLSVGYAQFDNTNPSELTAKVFRFDSQNNRWCRQSEELPLHRCVDLCNLIVQSIMRAEGINYNHVNTQIQPQIEDEKGLDDIKKFYERIVLTGSCKTINPLREKLRELRVLINILNP